MGETHVKETVLDNIFFEIGLNRLQNVKIYKNNARIIIFIEILYWFEHINLADNNIRKYYLI